MILWRELFQEARRRLGSEIDARRIVERASGHEGTEFVLGLDQPVATRALVFFDQMVERRAAGEPLQYVVGRWGFRGLELLVDRRVLIPRPETETVVDMAVAELRRLSMPSAEAPAPTVVDLGTGSGAIALSLASEVPRARVWATDRSPEALAVARANLAGLGARAAARVRLVEGPWFEALPAELRNRVDLLVSNPPYVTDDEELPTDVAAWEPREALRAGPTGLEAVAEVVAGAPEWLARPGALVVEIAPHQADAALRLARRAGFTAPEVGPDLAGLPRALVARAPAP